MDIWREKDQWLFELIPIKDIDISLPGDIHREKLTIIIIIKICVDWFQEKIGWATEQTNRSRCTSRGGIVTTHQTHSFERESQKSPRKFRGEYFSTHLVDSLRRRNSIKEMFVPTSSSCPK